MIGDNLLPIWKDGRMEDWKIGRLDGWIVSDSDIRHAQSG